MKPTYRISFAYMPTLLWLYPVKGWGWDNIFINQYNGKHLAWKGQTDENISHQLRRLATSHK